MPYVIRMAPSSVSTRDRQSPDVRRAQLLDAAVSAIAAHGFDGVTVRDVAQHAHVSAGLLHHYFDSFPELIAEAFARCAQASIDRLAAAVAACPGPLERLDRLVTLYAPVERDEDWLLWLSAWGAAPRQEGLRATAERLHVAWTEQFHAVLRDGVQAGVFDCPEPLRATRRLISLLDGLATQIIALGVLEPSEIAHDIGLAVARETGRSLTDFPGIASIGTARAAGPRR